jgi:thiol-disulfide isomerase/thioredoxin
VNFWGSWCEPCKAEEGFLSAAYDQLHGKVRFLGIDSIDSADSALSFDAQGVKPPVHFPSVFDSNGKALLAVRRQGPPYTMFIGSNGQVVGKQSTPYSSTADVLADVTKYLHVTA